MSELDELRARAASGAPFELVLFWGHTPKSAGAVDKACLSQWYPAPFDVDGRRYPTAEHCMMAAKARLFGDEETRARVLAAPDPATAKKLGREVRGFDNERWTAARVGIVRAASHAKFAQNEALGAFLRATGDAVLAEASATDPIWGIGLAESDARAQDPCTWIGLNLLGFALMDARARLRVG